MYTLYLILCIIKNVSGQINTDYNLRVQHGEDIEEGQYPYAVTLFFAFKGKNGPRASRYCTGSVIADQWTLTAAHCVAIKFPVYLIWYGNHTVPLEVLLSKNLYSKVLKKYIHPSFRINFSLDGNGVTDNDISLLHTQKITLNSYGGISAVDHTTMIGLPVTYVGGGVTNKPGDDNMRPLQVGEAVISPCDPEMKEIGKYIICISPKCSKKMQRPLKGDSGGPLIYDGKIIGVMSFGIKETMVMEAYAPISPYIEWISGLMLSEEYE